MYWTELCLVFCCEIEKSSLIRTYFLVLKLLIIQPDKNIRNLNADVDQLNSKKAEVEAKQGAEKKKIEDEKNITINELEAELKVGYPQELRLLRKSLSWACR